MKYRLAVITSHPVQYQAPLFKILAAHPEIELKVYYGSDHSIRGSLDPGFGINVRWDRPLLDGYDSKFLHSTSEIISVLRNEDFDAVFLHSYANLLSLGTYLGAMLTGTPILLHTESENLRRRNWLFQWVKKLALSILFRNTAAFLCIGQCNYRFYKEYRIPEQSIFSTPYCVDNDFFLSQAAEWSIQKAQILNELSLPSSQPTVLFSGKLISRKRPFDLLEAYEGLSRDKTPFNLIFIGDGILRTSLEERIQERRLKYVRLVGFKNQLEISKYYAAGDVFVLPSQFDTWGLVVNEAMLFGMPIITTDQVGSGYDLVEENQTGFVYPVGNVSSLVEKLNILVQDPQKSKWLGENARHKVLEYNYRQCVDGILKALQYVTRP